MCYYMPDEDFGTTSSLFVPYFGILTSTLTTLGRMAAIGKATVIPVMGVLKKEGGTEITVFPPLESFPNGDQEQEAIKMNQALEACVRLAPEQYMWTQRWFRTRPAGESSLYP